MSLVSRSGRLLFLALALPCVPLLTGAAGDGCAAVSKSPAPDVSGDWSIAYEDTLGVEIKIGGATYNAELAAEGGTVTIEHAGATLAFDLDCSRPEVVCPSEAWPESVSIAQDNSDAEHQMIVTLPFQSCSTALVPADPEACGEGTNNPDCADVCEGEIEIEEKEAFGVIGEAGESFRLYLGAGIASNGINCALLGWSVADAALESKGEETEEWQATDMTDGVVTVAYAGGCLWLAQVDADPELEAAVLGASVTFTVGFTGERK